MKFGFDFGTTNSSISIACLPVCRQARPAGRAQNGRAVVLPVDIKAADPRVVRSMLYFFRRELIYKENIPLARIRNQNFMLGDIQYRGEFKNLIGQEAVNQYCCRPGIRVTCN